MRDAGARTLFDASASAYETFDLDRVEGASGTLYVAELGLRFGTTFGRVFFITDVPDGAVRGGHAHMEQAECLICVRGAVAVHVEKGARAGVVELDRPGRALYLPRRHWVDRIEFSPGAILAVLAEGQFDEADYERDHSAFRRLEMRRR